MPRNRIRQAPFQVAEITAMANKFRATAQDISIPKEKRSALLNEHRLRAINMIQENYAFWQLYIINEES